MEMLRWNKKNNCHRIHECPTRRLISPIVIAVEADEEEKTTNKQTAATTTTRTTETKLDNYSFLCGEQRGDREGRDVEGVVAFALTTTTTE